MLSDSLTTCCFDDDICTTEQVPHCSWGWTSSKQHLAHSYTPEIPDLLNCPVWWCRQPWGSNWGSSGFCRLHMQKHAKQMRPWFLCAVQQFTRVYLHARTAVVSGDIRTWQTTVILITGKTQRPPIWAPCQNKMAQVLGSPVYIYGLANKSITPAALPTAADCRQLNSIQGGDAAQRWAQSATLLRAVTMKLRAAFTDWLGWLNDTLIIDKANFYINLRLVSSEVGNDVIVYFNDP